MFWHFLGQKSFDSSKGPLVPNQASLPITFGGIGFILTSSIAATTYLRSWALIVLIIAIGFMVDQHPFLFETLAQVDNNTFPFQQHFKATSDLLPPLVRVCLLLFKQFIRQQMIQFQDSILECLHHHTFSNMLFDMASNAYHAWILSCSNPRVSTWLIVWLVFPNFWLFFPIFSTSFCM